jgi:hypothetical protein
MLISVNNSIRLMDSLRGDKAKALFSFCEIFFWEGKKVFDKMKIKCYNNV